MAINNNKLNAWFYFYYKGGLSSYTSKLANNDYQLGNFDAPSPKKTEIKKSETELIEDYLKPDSEDTTWSNEITADILF